MQGNFLCTFDAISDGTSNTVVVVEDAARPWDYRYPQGTKVAEAPKTLGFVPQSAPMSSSTSSTYLVLALASLVVVVGQQLFSRFGVHLLLRAH